MARSVSCANDSVWVLYAHMDASDRLVFLCSACGEMVEETDEAPVACACCGHSRFTHEPAYPADEQRYDFCGNLCSRFMQAFPSLEICDIWLGREDHALLENALAYIGVSEYMGLFSVWCVPKPSTDWRRDTSAFGSRWAASIEDRAAWILERFAVRLVSVGRMSNGEGVYRRVGPAAR